MSPRKLVPRYCDILMSGGSSWLMMWKEARDRVPRKRTPGGADLAQLLDPPLPSDGLTAASTVPEARKFPDSRKSPVSRKPFDAPKSCEVPPPWAQPPAKGLKEGTGLGLLAGEGCSLPRVVGTPAALTGVVVLARPTGLPPKSIYATNKRAQCGLHTA